MKKNKLTTGIKIGYGIGDLVAGLAFQTINFHYLFFLNAMIGLPGYLSGMVLLLGRAWDGIADPFMGMLVDNTVSKKGKHRFWLILSIIPFAAAFIFIWLPIGGSLIFRFIFYALLFVLFSTFFTVYNVPYGAMTADLTADYHERTSLTAVRIVFSLLATIIGAGAVEIIVSLFSPKGQLKSSQGYMAMSVIFGIIMVISGIASYLSTRGHDTVAREKHGFKLQYYLNTFKNKPFVILLGSFFFYSLATTGLSSIFVYYINYNLGLTGFSSSLIMGVLIISSIFALPVWTAVSRKFGKKAALLSGSVVLAASIVIISGIGLTLGYPVFYLFVVIAGIGLSTFFVILWSILPDVVDYGEYLHGKRSEGLYYGIWFFIQKLGMAVSFLINGVVLSVSHFQSANAGGIIKQTAEALGGIKLLLSIIPVILIIIGSVFLLFYPITREFHEKITAIDASNSR